MLIISRLSKQKVVYHLCWKHLQHKWIFTILFKLSNHQSHQVSVLIFFLAQLFKISLFSEVLHLKLRRQFFNNLLVYKLTNHIDYLYSSLLLISIRQNTIVWRLKLIFYRLGLFFSCLLQIFEKFFQLFVIQ